MKQNWQGKKVVVVGAARQGLALTRYLLAEGAEVTLTDCRPEQDLVCIMDSFSDQPIRWVLGGHPFEILDGQDLVCVSGGVPLELPFILEARSRQIPLSNDSQILLEACPCEVVGITGSAGKTTTTALVGLMAETYMQMKARSHKAWVGGNIGNPLIEQVRQMHEDDLVILELSSFQLELMSTSPQVAAVLNITPNHLDRHHSMEAYAGAKANILRFQHAGDVAILNRDDPGSWKLANQLRSDLISFGMDMPGGDMSGIYVKREHIYLKIGRDQIKMMPVEWIRLRGQHNLYNVLAACAIAAGASLALPAIQSAVESFEGVPHRLEFVRNFKGADWYNDSIATAPERAMAAIRAFDNPLVLLLGGKDKDLPWEDLMALVRERVDHLVVFGAASEKILNTLGSPKLGGKPLSVAQCAGLKEAIQAAAEVVSEGDVVLLSPGGTSFDEFRDFAERGEFYRKWVNELL